MEQAASLGPLAQYGAVGIVAGLLFATVLVLFRQFVNNAIKTNADLQKQNFDMQVQSIAALNGIKAELVSMKHELSTDIRELDHTIGQMFNELSSLTGGSRGYAIGVRPPKRGG